MESVMADESDRDGVSGGVTVGVKLFSSELDAVTFCEIDADLDKDSSAADTVCAAPESDVEVLLVSDTGMECVTRAVSVVVGDAVMDIVKSDGVARSVADSSVEFDFEVDMVADVLVVADSLRVDVCEYDMEIVGDIDADEDSETDRVTDLVTVFVKDSAGD